MCPPLDDLARLKHENAISLLNRTKPMRNSDCSPPPRSTIKRILDDLLALAIERRGRLIEQQDARITDKCPRDGDALFLAAGEHDALVAYDGGEAVGKREDEGVDVCVLAGLGYAFVDVGGFVHFFVAEAEEDVFPDGALVEGWLLADEGKVVAVGADVNARDGRAVEGYGAREGVVEAFEEADCGGLAAAGGADQGNVLAWRNGEVETTENGHFGACGIAEVDLWLW